MCEEESDDTEAVAKLLNINDSIHRTIERYRLVKKGDLEGAAKIPQGTLGISGVGVQKGPNNELSLIDFGGDEESAAPPAASGGSAAPASEQQPKKTALEDDLLGLSLGDGPSGAISLGPGPSSNGLFDMAGPSAPAPAQQIQAASPAPPSIPQAQSQPPKANYDPFGLMSSQPSSKPHTPAPQSIGHQAPPPSRADPFAALSSPPRQASPSPFQFQQSTHAVPLPSHPSASLLNLGQSNGAAATAGPALNTTAPADDEWTFESSLPEQAQDLTITDSSIKTVFHVSRPVSYTHLTLPTKRIV